MEKEEKGKKAQIQFYLTKLKITSLSSRKARLHEEVLSIFTGPPSGIREAQTQQVPTSTILH